jgi:secretion/DNA translocation related TadE-like protein
VATGLVAAGLLLLSGLVAAAIVLLLMQTNAHRVQGAADLVAVTAAQAKNLGTSLPCAAAVRAAEADDVQLIDCEVRGDELSFVVTVTVRGGSGRILFGLPVDAEASAHAGATVER